MDTEQQRAEAALSSVMGQIRGIRAPMPFGGPTRAPEAVLIAIGGKPTAGKDAMADHLVEAHGFVKTFFSDPLNRALIVLNPQVRVPLWDRIKNFRKLGIRRHTYASIVQALGYTRAKTIREIRRLLQHMGTDVGRNMFGEDLWVNMAREWIRAELAAGRSVVLTGVRMPNELAMVQALGGHSVYVVRPGVPEDAHPYENAVTGEEFDHIVVNGGNLSSLGLKTDVFLENIRSQ